MSLNYGTLRTELRTLSHRGTEITDANLKSFVRKAEGTIARELRAVEMLTRYSFTETDRVAGGIYTLPTGWLSEGIIWNPDDEPMDKVGLEELRTHAATLDPFFFAPLSETEIEFRGSPANNSTFECLYFKRPTAFSGDSDVNTLLTNHEDIYVDAGLAALYLFTQDIELASAHSDAASRAIETLNEQAGAMLAGARTKQAYNLSSHRSR